MAVTGFGMAFDSAIVLKAMAAFTGDESGGITRLNKTPQRGSTMRMVVKSFTAGSVGGGAIRLRVLSAHDSTSVFQTIAASPAINATAMDSVGDDGMEVNVRFGTEWDYIKYVLDTFGTVSGSVEIGVVEDAIKFPKWDWFGNSAYWTDGADVIA